VAVVAACAWLSPGTTWDCCIADTKALALDSTVKVTTYRANAQRALDMLRIAGLAEDWVDGPPKGAPKVHAFARAILGDVDAIVLDRHIFRRLVFVDATKRRDDIIYCKNIVRGLADDLRIANRDAQAVLWLDTLSKY